MAVTARKLLHYSLAALALAAIGVLLFMTAHAQAGEDLSQSIQAERPSPDWEIVSTSGPGSGIARRELSAEVPGVSLPRPERDNCLHCHISGEDKGLWTPLARWSLFGVVGMVFAYGVYRSTSVFVTKSPWKPLTLRMAQWVDERYRVSEPLQQILNKPVPKFAMRWWYCLGGITAFLFAVQATTGILLSFYYQPTPEAAYASIQYIENEVRFGSAIRAIHSWSANGMIVMCIAHMLRVFIMGAYRAPRELNWVSGVFLFVLTLAFGFTGYLLPWDQRAYWATTVGTEIAAAIPVIGDLALVYLRVGWDVAGQTLSRFYSLHVIVLPISVLVTMGAHFLMIRRLGIAKPL